MDTSYAYKAKSNYEYLRLDNGTQYIYCYYDV
jgi:hypothetical protein